MNAKVWWKSKTLWFNIITVLVGVIGQVTDVFTLDAKTSQIFAGILAVGNFLLRFLTETPVTTSSKNEN
jgi:hypothetical protein